MVYKIITKPVKYISHAVRDVGTLLDEELLSEVKMLDKGLFTAIILGVEYKTSLGARNYIERYQGKCQLEVYEDE